MSLIDDALRRAREESLRRETGKGPGSRWAPSHVPGRKRARASAVAALAAVFLAGAAVAWLVVKRSPAGNPAPAAAAPPLPAARPSPAAVAPPPAASPPRSIPASEKPVSRARSREALPTRRAPREEGSAAPPATVPREGSRPSPASPRSYVHEARIGDFDIELGGIVFSDSNPVALINGKVVSPGASIGDYTVVRIRPEAVDFSGDGVTFSILLR